MKKPLDGINVLEYWQAIKTEIESFEITDRVKNGYRTKSGNR